MTNSDDAIARDAGWPPRPVVQARLNPARPGGAWELFISDPRTHKCVVIGVPDDGNWNVSPQFQYVEGTELDPWIGYDSESLRQRVTWLNEEVAALKAELAALRERNGVTA